MSTSKLQAEASFPGGTQDHVAIAATLAGLNQLAITTLARFHVSATVHSAGGLLEETRRLRAIATRLDAYRRLLLREWANEEKTESENRTANHAK